MGDRCIVVQPVGEGNFEASVRFLTGWVSDGAAEARAYLAGHAEPAGASLIAVQGADVAGYVAIVWESNFAGFRDHGIPLVHQLAVAGPFRRHGVATVLMDAAEQLAGERGVTTLGITVGLFDEYGPAQRLYGRRGYVPDGRGACRAQRPLGRGMQVIMDDDLIMWLTKDLVRLRPAPHLSGRRARFRAATDVVPSRIARDRHPVCSMTGNQSSSVVASSTVAGHTIRLPGLRVPSEWPSFRRAPSRSAGYGFWLASWRRWPKSDRYAAVGSW